MKAFLTKALILTFGLGLTMTFTACHTEGGTAAAPVVVRTTVPFHRPLLFWIVPAWNGIESSQQQSKRAQPREGRDSGRAAYYKWCNRYRQWR